MKIRFSKRLYNHKHKQTLLSIKKTEYNVSWPIRHIHRFMQIILTLPHTPSQFNKLFSVITTIEKIHCFRGTLMCSV